MLLTLSCFLLATYALPARADQSTAILEKSGIRYPDGFDLNTVGELRGKVHNIVRPEKGPVIFDIVTSKDSYTIIASPSWFWDDLNTKISEGDDIRVIGSRAVGKDGKLYVVAQELYVGGSSQPIVLRDENGRALWRSGPGNVGSRGSYGIQGGRSAPAGGRGGRR